MVIQVKLENGDYVMVQELFGFLKARLIGQVLEEWVIERLSSEIVELVKDIDGQEFKGRVKTAKMECLEDKVWYDITAILEVEGDIRVLGQNETAIWVIMGLEVEKDEFETRLKVKEFYLRTKEC